MAEFDFEEIVPQKYPRAYAIYGTTGVRVAVYHKQKPDAKSASADIKIVLYSDILAKLRWRKGDRVWFDRDVRCPFIIRVKRTDGTRGSRLAPSAKDALEINITAAAFGAKAAPSVSITEARVLAVSPDALIIELPLLVRPAFGVAQ